MKATSVMRKFLAALCATLLVAGSASFTPDSSAGVRALSRASGGQTKLLSAGLPLIIVPTGTVAANGVITLGTALGRVIPKAMCGWPANAVATVAAAGFRYCEFTTTTVGQAYLDTYSGTGTPTVPASPTIVTDGKGAYTGLTTAQTLYTATLPGGALGLNGSLGNRDVRLEQQRQQQERHLHAGRFDHRDARGHD
jgi:hypothetical protein